MISTGRLYEDNRLDILWNCKMPYHIVLSFLSTTIALASLPPLASSIPIYLFLFFPTPLSLNESIYMSPFLNAGRALDQNFVFASLDNSEKQILTCAMETVMVKEGEELITQGRVTSSPFLSDFILFILI